ncbi:MAG TPA: U32 family peptidase [Myxococcota bacterium]|jgi:collagenase-like PrtC family protease|nr:U32 family peptidase [Myxococcota bacterium]
MELIVPAVFAPSFLDAMATLPIGHLYGSLPEDPSLRASGWLPDARGDLLERTVAEARRRGLAFYYALNAHCLGNREFSAEGQRFLVERLGRLVEAGVEGVVLANPYLVRFAKRRFPELRVTVSTATAIDSVDKALFFEDCGADLLYLPEFVNRDLRLLREVRRRVRCRLALLANVGCLLHCPLRSYHVDLVSHSGESQELGTYVDYPLLWCTKEKSRDGAQMLKAPWIRPEDLSLYEELGYEEFKLAGREMDPIWIERAARAYAGRRHEGDLNDLVLGFDHLEPFGKLPNRIPNRALDGFVQYFRRKHDCRLGCRDCTYCDEFAERVLRREGDPRAFADRLERSLERLESGAFRSASGR